MFLIIGAVCLLSIVGASVMFARGNIRDKHKSEVIEIILKNHRFEPNIIEVPKGKKISLTIYNQDAAVEEFESNDLHREKIIMPHGHVNFISAPLASGKYNFFGDFYQETAQGSLIIK